MLKGMTFKDHFCKPGTSGSNSSPYGLWHLDCQQKRSAHRWWNFLGPIRIEETKGSGARRWLVSLVLSYTQPGCGSFYDSFSSHIFQSCWGKHLPVLWSTRDPSTLRGLSPSRFPSFQKNAKRKKAKQQLMDRQVFTSSLAQSFLQIMDHPRCNLAATKLFTEIGQRTRGILDIPHDFDSCNPFKHTTNATLRYYHYIIYIYIYSIDWTIHIIYIV